MEVEVTRKKHHCYEMSEKYKNENPNEPFLWSCMPRWWYRYRKKGEAEWRFSLISFPKEHRRPRWELFDYSIDEIVEYFHTKKEAEHEMKLIWENE